MKLSLDPSVWALSKRIAEAFAARGCELYLGGGLVRDALLGAPAGADLDFATSASPTESRAALAAAGAKVYDVGERFGTIGGAFPYQLGDSMVLAEVTTYRAESYQPGSRKPAVSFHGDLRDDLARRDLTINAIAIDPLTEELQDPFGGQEDLRQGIVRAVGEPSERFREDPLRLLRTARFATKLRFRVDPQTAAAAQQQAASLDAISRERVRDELDKLLMSPAPAAGNQLLCDLGLLPYTLPQLLDMQGMRQEAGRHKDVYSHTLQVLDRTPPRLPLRWAALLHDVAKPATLSVGPHGEVHFLNHERKGERMARRILTDLKHSSETVERVARLVGLHLRANAYEQSWTDGAVRRFVREVGDDLLEDLLALSRADVTTGRPERRLAIARSVARLEERIVELRAQEDIAKLSSPLDGTDLMAMFERGPGPWIRPIKDHLLNLVLDGQLGMDDKEQATQIAHELYQQLQG